MSKTRADYGSGIARPKIRDKDSFELKGQFLKELRDNTFSGSDHEDANEHIEKVLEIVDLFHIPNITQYQVMLRAFPISLTGVEVILFYNGLEVPTRQILISKGVIPSKTAFDAKMAIQEMAEYSQKWHNGISRTKSTETSDELAAIQAQFNNLGREIKKVNEKVYAAQVRCEQCKGPHYTKDCPLKEEGKISKVLQERGFGSLPSSTEANPRDHFKSISTTAKADSNPICRIGSPQYAVSTLLNRRLMFESRQTIILFPSHLNNYYCEGKKGSYGPQFSEAYSYGASHIDNSIPRKEKNLGSFTLPCYINNVWFDNALADLGAS
ncbi:hypothetical protein Tco_1325733, partial [Tanacetum coccineum]